MSTNDISARLAIIGAPVSGGAYAPGQEKAPEAVRGAGLIRALKAKGIEPVDLGDVDFFRWCLDRENPQRMHAEAVNRSALQVAQKLQPVLAADGRALILGGDCTVEIGVAAAAANEGCSFGLIYIDLDSDLNVPESSGEGAFDWMGVAHMLRIEGADATILQGFGSEPMLRPDQILYFGTGNVKPFERDQIERLGISEISIEEVAADPTAAAGKALNWASRFDRMLIHLDVDVLDYAKFPLAENTRRGVGLDYSQLIASLEVLLQAPNWRVLTITELNPDHCSDPEADLSRLVTDLAAILGGSIPTS